MKEYCIKVNNKEESQKAVSFLASLRFDKNGNSGNASSGYYYTTSCGKIRCESYDKLIPSHITIDTLESLKARIEKETTTPTPLFKVGDRIRFKSQIKFSYSAPNLSGEEGTIKKYDEYSPDKKGYALDIRIESGQRKGTTFSLNECDILHVLGTGTVDTKVKNPDPIFKVGDTVVFKDLECYSYLSDSANYKNQTGRITHYREYQYKKSIHSGTMIDGYGISVVVTSGERVGANLHLNECDFVKNKSTQDRIYDLEKDLEDLAKQHKEVKEKQPIITINTTLPYEKKIEIEQEQKIVLELEPLLSINQNN